MSSRVRADRVGQLVQEVVARALACGMADPRIGFVTITDVEVSPDLRHATVFYSVIGDDVAHATTKEGLEAARGFLQHAVASALKLRHTPRLRFAFDASVERGDRIERLLKEAKGR